MRRVLQWIAAPAGAAWLAFVLLAAPHVVQAQSQYVIRAPGDHWRTAKTEHWVVHYPARASAFANCLLPRLEPIYRETSALVGYSTRPRVTLVIEDAMSFAGAYASANARAPVIVLQTQPSPPGTGGYSDCTTARMVHELTHILQLSRPYTSAFPLWQRAMMRLLPAEPGPIVLRRQAWLRESYAERIEGRLTPTGAPYTTARANMMRLLGIADQLPSYDSLSASYVGQYLVGSAFVDWLAERSGDEAFRKLWMEMGSARYPGDAEVFRTLFGATPDSLYRMFTADAKLKARQARDRFTKAGIVRGEFVRTVGNADEVTVSADGKQLAAVFGAPLLQATLWSSHDSTATPLKLPIPTGQSPNAPRFTHNGDLLIVNWERLKDGHWRPDVYEWMLASKKLRRITHGASVREVDPFPDGKTAAGVRCEFGVCDVVRIDLTSGALTLVAAGAPDRAYSHPRVSPDGRTIAVAVQTGATSRIALLDDANGTSRLVDPDDGVWRYDPAFLRNDKLVVVSEASGVPNLELLDVSTGKTSALTRLVAPVFAPQANTTGDTVYFIRTAPGSEVWRIAVADSATTTISIRDSSLAPAAPVPLPRPSPSLFSAEAMPATRRYGAGQRFYTVLPGTTWNVDGATGSAMLWTSDIVGRLSMMAEGTFGNTTAWHGAALSAALRFTQLPVFVNVVTARANDTRVDGVSARTQLEGGTWAHQWRLSPTITFGSATADGTSLQRRMAAGATFSATHSQVHEWYATEYIDVSVTTGATGNSHWNRGMVSATLDIGRTSRSRLATLSVMTGATNTNAPVLEHLSIGGSRAAGIADPSLDQFITQPLLAIGSIRGSQTGMARVSGPRIGPATPFASWSGSFSDERRSVTILGLTRELSSDPRRNWRVPGARLIGGTGYAFGSERGVRGFLSLTFVQ